MKTLLELESYLERLGIPDAGKALVRRAWRDGPARKVRSSGHNVTGDVDSEKMQARIPYESRTLEYPAIVVYERDDSVLGYFAQPFKLDLRLTDGGMKTRFRISHYPDFLVLQEDRIEIHEWRERERMERLAMENPGRFVLTDGVWHWREVETYLAELGFVYRIRTRDELGVAFVANLRFLTDYFSAGCGPSTNEAKAALRLQFSDRLCVSLATLIADARRETPKPGDAPIAFQADDPAAASYTTDDIYKAIARGDLAFDLHHEYLSEPTRAHVYRDGISMEFEKRARRAEPRIEEHLDESLTLGCSVLYDDVASKVLLLSKTHVVLQQVEEDTAVEISLETLRILFANGRFRILPNGGGHNSAENDLPTPSPKELEAALLRAQYLEMDASSRGSAPLSIRQMQRLRKAQREAGDSALRQQLALVPNHRARGNRNTKLPEELLGIIKTVAEKQFNDAAAITKSKAYEYFQNACNAAGVVACSQKTFNLRLDGLTKDEKRVGTRLADKKKPRPLFLTYGEPMHGVRAWEYVHIDHTVVDLELKSVKGLALRRAWLTVAICAATRKIIGFYATFSAPSYISCMMVLRDIVRRHGRLPETIVVDNGSDFRSKAFRTFCTLYRVGLRFRPKGKPRYGSVMERVFGTTNTQFVHNLQGNTKVMRHVRGVTRAVNPDNFVDWTLAALHGGLDFYFNQIYGETLHPAYDEKPNDRFNRLVHEAGPRVHKWVRFDRTFKVLSSPHADVSPTRIVDQVRGVKVNNAYYTCKALQTPRVHGQKVEVRVEPWNPAVIYVLIQNAWHACHSRMYASYMHLSALELQHALREVETRDGRKPKDMSPEHIRERLRLMKPENFDKRLNARQDEMRAVYVPLGMCSAIAEESVELREAPAEKRVEKPERPTPTPKDGPTQTAMPTSDADSPTTEDDDEYALLY